MSAKISSHQALVVQEQVHSSKINLLLLFRREIRISSTLGPEPECVLVENNEIMLEISMHNSVKMDQRALFL